MSLMHAILGFLRRAPQTGYALKNERFDKSVAYFWPADQTQIYKTLDKLVESGFATAEIEIQSDRPNRKNYSITKAGKEELVRWLKDSMEPVVIRDPLLVQVFFSDFIDADDLLEVLAKAKVFHEKHLEKLQAIQINSIARCTTREELGARLTLELGLKNKQAYLEWLDQATEAVTSMQRKHMRAKSK